MRYLQAQQRTCSTNEETSYIGLLILETTMRFKTIGSLSQWWKRPPKICIGLALPTSRFGNLQWCVSHLAKLNRR